MADTEKEVYPVKVQVFTTLADGNEICLMRKTIDATESRYYFGAEPLRNKVIAELMESFRVELTIVFPAKDELG